MGVHRSGIGKLANVPDLLYDGLNRGEPVPLVWILSQILKPPRSWGGSVWSIELAILQGTTEPPESLNTYPRTVHRHMYLFHPSSFASVPSSSFQSATRIERWSLVNAIGMLCAAGAAHWGGSPWPLLLIGIGSLGGLVVAAREQWTPQGRFGAANGVTALRVGLLVCLPAAAAAPSILIALSVCILATDGLDGWLARRGTLESAFGAFFDKETDALFLLTLCALAAFRGRLPVWILGVGLLRYGFVLLLFLVPSGEKTEERSTWARYVYGGMVAALLTSFLPYPTLYRPLVALAAGALVLSFARSIWHTVGKQPVAH